MAEKLIVKLKLARTTAGFTQEQLAEKCGVTRKTINTVERGHFIPSTLLALRLASALQTSVEALFAIEK